MSELIKRDSRTGLMLSKEVRRLGHEDLATYSLGTQPPRALPGHLAPVDAGDLAANLRAFDAINAFLLENAS